MNEKQKRRLVKVRPKRIFDPISRKVKIAVDMALREHKEKNVPAIVLDRDTGIIYELHADGRRVPIDIKREAHYSEKTVD